ncbi:hypothetical protein NDU88_008946 [Pleurodeles waltl]|uniref:Uncharacterized protein n=1 Tax=Pleurodeles waltl TaxID=8319 RepID=A0AAV7RUN2_PLEWA|nr:hypothetical protein NDU88_008946 [Pleurodeles waltl]
MVWLLLHKCLRYQLLPESTPSMDHRPLLVGHHWSTCGGHNLVRGAVGPQLAKLRQFPLDVPRVFRYWCDPGASAGQRWARWAMAGPPCRSRTFGCSGAPRVGSCTDTIIDTPPPFEF